ncbi:MAG TPA: hypothetical protein VJR89_25250 [Polyangiales bacterium]|nr:hypothetical protein [Polyangiales bacterium]
MTSITRRRAGSAYLEALGVSLMLVLLFAFALRFARAGRARLEQLRAARASAWADALQGCEPSTTSLPATAEAWARLRPDAARALLERGLTQRATARVLCNEPPPLELGERDAFEFLSTALAESEAP